MPLKVARAPQSSENLSMVEQLPDTALSYAAGIIDGEGCIRTNRNARGPAVRVHVTNTNPKLVAWLHERFGGYVWSEGKSYTPRAKPRYVWEVSSRAAEGFLRAVLPYLVLKRAQAEVALALRALIGRGRVSKETREAREALVGELHFLNRKGRSDASS